MIERWYIMILANMILKKSASGSKPIHFGLKWRKSLVLEPDDPSWPSFLNGIHKVPRKWVPKRERSFDEIASIGPTACVFENLADYIGCSFLAHISKEISQWPL